MSRLACQSRIGQWADGWAAGLLWTKESEQAQVLIARFSEMPYPINARVDWGCGVGGWVFCPDFVLK